MQRSWEIIDLIICSIGFNWCGFNWCGFNWYHLVRVKAIDDNTALYTDKIEINAVILKIPVVFFAQFFYRYRQRRWMNVAGSLADRHVDDATRPDERQCCWDIEKCTSCGHGECAATEQYRAGTEACKRAGLSEDGTKAGVTKRNVVPLIVRFPGPSMSPFLSRNLAGAVTLVNNWTVGPPNTSPSIRN